MNELASLVLLCAGCHGMAGDGRAAAGYPPIAGQPPAYLERQLAAYADGRRPDIVMSPLAKRLSGAQKARIAVHYSGLKAPEGDGAENARGKVLATVGDDELRVQACRNCHGPGGIGRAPLTPYLAGLPAGYLRAQLLQFRSGARRTDASGAMSAIAARLSEQDIAAVAAYYGRDAD